MDNNTVQKIYEEGDITYNTTDGTYNVYWENPGNLPLGKVTYSLGDYWYQYYYPIYYSSESKTDVAFKVIKKLMDEKIIKIDTVKKFINVVELISKEL